MSPQSQTKEFSTKSARVGERFPDATISGAEQGLLSVECSPGALQDVLSYLRDDEVFRLSQLSDLTAVDEPKNDRLVLLYRLIRPIPEYDTVLVRAAVPREGATVKSAIGLWANADWYEREVYDMFGVHFEGHPDPRRILTWEGFEGHPLKKDYSLPEGGEVVPPSE